SPTPGPGGSSAGSCATRAGGSASTRSLRDEDRAVRAAAPAAVLHRLPDAGERHRGRGRGPGDLGALPDARGGPELPQGVPLGGGDPDLDRRAAVGPGAAGAVRRPVVPRAPARGPV